MKQAKSGGFSDLFSLKPLSLHKFNNFLFLFDIILLLLYSNICKKWQTIKI